MNIFGGIFRDTNQLKQNHLGEIKKPGFGAIRAVSGHLGGSPGSTGPPLSGRLGGVWVLLNGAKHSSAGLGFRFCRGGGNQAFRPLEQYLVFTLHFDHMFAIFSKSRDCQFLRAPIRN